MSLLPLRSTQPPALWVAAVVLGILAVGWLDYVTGVELGFFVFYFVPIALAAWRFGLAAAVGTSVLSAACWLAADLSAGSAYSHPSLPVWNSIVRLAAFLVIGWAIARIQTGLDRERTITADLAQALAEVRALKGLLPVCAWCNRIQDEAGEWQGLDTYIASHTDATVTHGMCESCAQEMLEREGSSLG